MGLWREKSYTSLRLPLESGRPKLPLVGVSLLVFLRASPLAQSLLSFAKGLLAAFPSCGGASVSCYYVRAPLQLVEHPGTTSWCLGNVNGAAKPFFPPSIEGGPVFLPNTSHTPPHTSHQTHTRRGVCGAPCPLSVHGIDGNDGIDGNETWGTLVGKVL